MLAVVVHRESIGEGDMGEAREEVRGGGGEGCG